MMIYFSTWLCGARCGSAGETLEVVHASFGTNRSHRFSVVVVSGVSTWGGR